MVAVPLLVLGARFTGLATALCLAHQGFPVHVLDREPRVTTDHDVVALGPAAYAELADLGLVADLADGVREPGRLVHADARTGAVLRVAELGPAVRARYGRPYLLVRRSALRALFAAACEADDMVTVEYDRPVAAVEDLGDAALVTTGDGALYRAEALVGADGPVSLVRRCLGGGHAVSAPHLVHRSVGPPARDDDVRVWSSPALHVTHVAGSDGRSLVTVVARLEALDDLHRDAAVDVVPRLLERCVPEVRSLTSDAGPAAVQIVRHHAPLDRWAWHRMTVVGCAAQPMLPHAAPSASLALLEAAALGRAFDRADGRIVPAFDGYARDRAALRADAAARALDFATLCHADGLMRRLRDRLWRDAPVDATAAVVDATGWEPRPAHDGVGRGGPVGPIAG